MKIYPDFYGFVLNMGDTAMKVVIFSLVHMMINHGIFGGALLNRDKPMFAFRYVFMIRF